MAATFLSLGRPRDAFKDLHALISEPTEFVVVPHIDKWPACAGVLQVGIFQIRAIDRAIIGKRGRNVEIVDLFAMFITDDIAELAIVHALRAIFGIPDNFVNEIAEVQNETELILLRGRARLR